MIRKENFAEMTDAQEQVAWWEEQCRQQAGRIETLEAALDDLQSAETAYRMVYDLDGDHHQNTLQARAVLRAAGYRARKVMAKEKLKSECP